MRGVMNIVWVVSCSCTCCVWCVYCMRVVCMLFIMWCWHVCVYIVFDILYAVSGVCRV